MSKGMARKKVAKKKPLKTPEEKRAEKRNKKPQPDIVKRLAKIKPADNAGFLFLSNGS